MKSPGFAEHLSIRKLLTVFLSLLLILLVNSCSMNQQKENVVVPSDTEITQTITTKVEEAPKINPGNISVDVKKGVVQLSGEVDNILVKQRTAKIAEMTFGVLSVVNNLKVTATRPDEVIDSDIGRALKTDPATEAWEITADVNNGVVRLTGAVDSWQEKELAENIAMGVKGVREISNNIIVNYSGTRSDKQIRSEIKRTLTMDTRINDNMVDVEVDSGRVALTGAVGGAYEKTLAKQMAHVTGVKSVSVDELEVHPEYESRLFQNKKLEALTENEVKTAIERALTYDPRVPEGRINVDVDEDRAILSGKVENLNSKLAAENDAANTAGIGEVVNNITVERKVVVTPDIPTTDEAIKKRIREGILRDPYVEQVDIDIAVEKGIVALDGRVDNEFDKEQIEKIAQNVKGVIAINNNLSIRGPQT